MMKYVESGDGYSHSVSYEYDTINNLTQMVETINGVQRTTSYSYDKDNRVTSVTTDGITESYTYDTYGRIASKVTKNGDTAILTETYTYVANAAGDPTGQVATHKTEGANYSVTYTYDYDDNGNITSVSDGTYTTTYAYDSANQLIRENNPQTGKTYTWTYDNAGNILSKKTYAYTTGTVGTASDTASYIYGYSQWGDLLTAYDGTAITYDEIGNPLSDGTRSYTWKQGRDLATLSDGTSTWTNTYNADGLRTSRTNGTSSYSYVYNGSQLVQMTVDGNTLLFTYDASGTPQTVTYNGTTYFYATNLQGDVTAILDASGETVVSYTYDAWGSHTSGNNGTGALASTLGRYNPLRYRGYVYDVETDLYYLQSRYYNPAIGRFLNADILIATGQGMLGNNMFAYCGNNPISRVDFWGYSWIEDQFSNIREILSDILQNIVDEAKALVEDITHGYAGFLNALGMRESSGYYGTNTGNGYLGRYQMGKLALQEAGFKNSSGAWTSLANQYGVYSNADFLASPLAQNIAVTAYHKKLCSYIISYDLEKYVGTSFCGVTVTKSGLLAAAHLVGAKALQRSLKSGVAAVDGNGVPITEYMSLMSGYDISKVWGS